MSISTPWGSSDRIERISDEISFVSTPSHGGFKVKGKSLQRIPLEWRQASFNGQAMQGWFEEDCDWSMVALTFPELFAKDQEHAQSAFNHWIAPKLAAVV